MYGLALCLPSVGQPQGLPVPHEILKTPDIFSPCRRLPLSSCWVYPRPPPPLTLPPGAGNYFRRGLASVRSPNRAGRFLPPSLWDRRGMGLQSKPTNLLPLTKCHFITVVSICTSNIQSSLLLAFTVFVFTRVPHGPMAHQKG